MGERVKQRRVELRGSGEGTGGAWRGAGGVSNSEVEVGEGEGEGKFVRVGERVEFSKRETWERGRGISEMQQQTKPINGTIHTREKQKIIKRIKK